MTSIISVSPRAHLACDVPSDPVATVRLALQRVRASCKTTDANVLRRATVRVGHGRSVVVLLLAALGVRTFAMFRAAIASRCNASGNLQCAFADDLASRNERSVRARPCRGEIEGIGAPGRAHRLHQGRVDGTVPHARAGHAGAP
jgi:hypothetical protein